MQLSSSLFKTTKTSNCYWMLTIFSLAGFVTAEPCEQDANMRRVCLRPEETSDIQLWKIELSQVFRAEGKFCSIM
jgi:hypothetical protein